MHSNVSDCQQASCCLSYLGYGNTTVLLPRCPEEAARAAQTEPRPSVSLGHTSSPVCFECFAFPFKLFTALCAFEVSLCACRIFEGPRKDVQTIGLCLWVSTVFTWFLVWFCVFVFVFLFFLSFSSAGNLNLLSSQSTFNERWIFVQCLADFYEDKPLRCL